MLRLLTFLTAVFLASAAAATTLWVDAPRDGYLNLRSGPSVQYHVLDQMPHGSKVKLLKAPGKWVKVRHQSGLVGWAHGGFLSHHKPKTKPQSGYDRDHGGYADPHQKGTPYWVNAPKYGRLNLRAGPSRHDPVIDKLAHGSKVHVTGQHGRWYRLRANGTVGWANSKFLSKHKVIVHDKTEPFWVNTPKRGYLNMRAGPSRDYHTVVQIPHGSKVHVIRKQDQWFKLRHDGHTGWVNQRFLSKQKPRQGGHAGGYDGRPTGQELWVYAPGYGGLNLRTGPGTTYDVIMTMQQRDKVVQLGRQGHWILLRHGSGATGWAHGDYLSKQDPGPVPGAKKGHKGGKKGGKDKHTDPYHGAVPWNGPDRNDPQYGDPKAKNLAQALLICAGRRGQDLQLCLLNQLGHIPQQYGRSW